MNVAAADSLGRRSLALGNDACTYLTRGIPFNCSSVRSFAIIKSSLWEHFSIWKIIKRFTHLYRRLPLVISRTLTHSYSLTYVCTLLTARCLKCLILKKKCETKQKENALAKLWFEQTSNCQTIIDFNNLCFGLVNSQHQSPSSHYFWQCNTSKHQLLSLSPLLPPKYYINH